MKKEEENKRLIVLSVGASSLLICMHYAYFGMKAVEPNSYISQFWGFALLILSAYWVMLDARLRKIGSPYTDGFLLYILWPIMVPAYAYKTYRLKGILVFIGFIGVLFSPYLAYYFGYMLLY